MRFADPNVCPSCGGAIAGNDRCPHCQLILNSPAALHLWQTLIQADALLEKARAAAVTAPPVGAIPASAPQPSMPPSAPQSMPRPARRLSTGSIILGLAALCLIVAALLFVRASWSVLGPTGRTLVLLAITMLVALGAAWVTRVRLRASAEALWGVFFGFFAIDFFAAREYGLLGLDTFDGSQAAFVFGLLTAILGATVVMLSRKTLTVVAPSIVAGIGVWAAVFALAAMVDLNFFWSVFAGFSLAAVATGILWQLKLRLAAVIAGVASAFLYVGSSGGAIEELASSPKLAQLAADAHGVPMVVMVVLTVAIGVAASRLAIPAATLATLGISALVFTPAEAASYPEGAYIAAAGVAVVLAAGLIRGANSWVRGARIAEVMILGVLSMSSIGWVGNAIESVAMSDDDRDVTSWNVRLPEAFELPGPGWLALIVFGAIAAAVFMALKWPEMRELGKHLTPLPALIGLVGINVAFIAFEPTVLLAALLALALSVCFLVIVRNEHPAWLGIGLLATIVPATMTFASQPVTLVIWLAVAAVLIAFARVVEPGWPGRAAASAASGLVIGSSAAAADMTTLDERGIRIVVVVTALAALGLASFLLRHFVGRREVEITAGLGILIALISASVMSLGSQALLWTIAGGVLVVLGLLVADRHFYRFVGSAFLGVAWVLRLAASDVETVEAYTAPFAVVLLGAGLLAMRRNPQLRTLIALTSGLTLALVPSLPEALDDPTGLRALLLGLGALTALGIGVWQKWQMPFVFGAMVAALLVLWNVGPLANGLPRWILLTIIGVILGGSAITWESRVRDARSAAQYVQNLR